MREFLAQFRAHFVAAAPEKCTRSTVLFWFVYLRESTMVIAFLPAAVRSAFTSLSAA